MRRFERLVIWLCQTVHCVARVGLNAAMKFHIEITRDKGIGTKVIYRTIVDEMSPERAKTKAGALIDLYSGRGANGARVLDQKNKELFRL